MPILKVFFTIDVEIWCDGWSNIDANFSDAFQRYIYGHTPYGDYGLPLQLAVFNDYGLKGCFFTESLFTGHFGLAPLEEIIGLIRQAGQEVQLHLHTEWVDEARVPLIPGALHREKRQYLRYFTQDEQTALIGAGLQLINAAGAQDVNAFRAGNFGFNYETLLALNDNGIQFDSSYNPCLLGLDSGLSPGQVLFQPVEVEGVIEYPMTVFRDSIGSGYRHAQLSACSFQELQSLLWQALEKGWNSIVLLSHSFELLNRSKNCPDHVVTRRFLKLCQFLDQHRDCFLTSGFADLKPQISAQQPKVLRTSLYGAGFRMAEQVWRRKYG